MTRRRRTVSMHVVVIVPMETTPKLARLEVRTLINDQCNYHLDPGDVRVKKIMPGTMTAAKGGKNAGLLPTLRRAEYQLAEEVERRGDEDAEYESPMATVLEEVRRAIIKAEGGKKRYDKSAT